MKYIKHKLTIEKVSVQNIAKRYGTPAYCYSYKQLKENIIKFKKSFKSFSPLICFAIKSNTNVSLIREIKKFLDFLLFFPDLCIEDLLFCHMKL